MRRRPQISLGALGRRSAAGLLFFFAVSGTAWSAAGHPARATLLAGPNAGAEVVYTSPVPGARYVHPETNLILRFDRLLDTSSAGALPGIGARGASSGEHVGHAHLSDDGRTLLFQPDRAFASGERVTVTLEGRDLLTFTTAATRPSWPAGVARLGESDLQDADPISRFLPLRRMPITMSSTLPPIALDTPSVSAQLYGPTAPGQILLASFVLGGGSPNFLMIVDNLGQPLFYRQMPVYCTDFKEQPNGILTYCDVSTNRYYALDASYAIVDSFECGNGYTTDLHELRILPNGHSLLLGDELQTVDMSAIVPGGNPAATVVGMVIQELDVDKNVVFEWRTFDHFQITDATHEDLTAAFIDYAHCNALEFDFDGNILLSSRHMDEITKIDRNTGDIIWRWGGKHNQFALVNDTEPFSHQHAVRRLFNGDITLFDNGNFHSPSPYSRAIEYTLDENSFTATRVWQFRNFPDSYGLAMGYVQRLPNGGTLIGWGTGKPDVIEVGPDNLPVLEMSLPAGQSSYRAYRTSWLPDLTGVGAPAPGRVSLSVNRPNPFHGRTQMFLSLPRAANVSCALYDLRGRRLRNVMDQEPCGPGLTRIGLDLTADPPGVYFVQAEVAGQKLSRRIVKLD